MNPPTVHTLAAATAPSLDQQAVASNGLPQLQPRQSPPSYEEAIVRPLNDTLTGNLLNAPLTSITTLSPKDYGTLDGDEAGDELEEEDEREYEASRPLKMGKVPDARAQYTFIQPTDTINSKKPSPALVPGPVNGMAHPAIPVYQAHPSAPPATDASNHQTYLPPPGPPPPMEQSDNDSKTMYSPPNHPPPPVSSPSAGGSSSAYDPPPVPFAGIPETPGLINAQDISIADFKKTNYGVKSYDKILADPYQLYRFFVAHNDRPTMHVRISGHHTERREECERQSDGQHKTVVKHVRINDFDIDFDLTPYIQPRGTLYTAPDPKTGIAPTLREVMEQFAEEENPFKEIHMQKNVVWDYTELTRAITHAIRCTNYRYTIDIRYPCSNNVVKVYSSAPVANFMRNNWTKALCCLSGVGIIFYPARALYRRVMDKTLKAEFQMAINTRDFYNAHYWAIVDQVQYR
ncbi:hypothetical protein BGZ83_008674 [Gryganskiella cystojenkinii]|nr:hypothetical protein BGZ83_008674 [Gryganskiella cystojenkinii]